MLLAGGRGQRLYPLTETHAKPLLAVANRPLLGVQLEFLEEAGFEGISYMASQHRNTKKQTNTNTACLSFSLLAHSSLGVSRRIVEVFVVTCEDRGHAEIATFLDETYRGKLKATVVPMEAGMVGLFLSRLVLAMTQQVFLCLLVFFFQPSFFFSLLTCLKPLNPPFTHRARQK